MKAMYILFFAAFVTAACDNNINGSNEPKATVPFAAPPTLPFADSSKKATISQQTTTTFTPAPAVKPTAALNPAHGQPGHRCDIAVGAPLSATPSSSGIVTNAAPVTVQPSSSQPVQNSSATKTPSLQLGTSNAQSGLRLNPAHGQPGHDCNIEVGKPLKQ